MVITPKLRKPENARCMLGWAALFLGELRDGLTMLNMQSAFLIASKNYSEKQVGVLFFVFGMSQFIFQTPAGYLMDYSEKKVFWLCFAGVATTFCTVFTAFFAEEEGGNLGLMVAVKFFQGAITALIPPGLNSITQGIVGAIGMTEQVSMNEIMNHLGTAIIMLTSSVIAFLLYPDIGTLFVVSPVACVGVVWFLNQIKPEDIDHTAARGLILEAPAKNLPLTHYGSDLSGDNPNTNATAAIASGSTDGEVKKNFVAGGDEVRADTPLPILRDPVLLIFILIVFLFHFSNATVLPLVMQSLAIGNGRSGILMSGLCIIVAQIFMVMTAKICGTYSGTYGRKPLFLIGFFSVPIRCLILTYLLGLQEQNGESVFLQCIILSTQVFDGIGAGVFGTMYVLVTSDISGGTGRFSLTLGLTTAAMSIGGTISGYLGEWLAQDLGYKEAFSIMIFTSLVPALLFVFFMPETLPSIAKKNKLQRMTRIAQEMEELVAKTDILTPSGSGYVDIVQ